tara:strand:- start:9555 stop:10325 length:771 start_codon:yes stop_codon:yes gene_type:complete
MLTINTMIDSVRRVSASEHDVARVNSIDGLYKDQRQTSKTPTFALTYQGTYITLMAKCGFTEAVAKQIESRYHDLYKVSDQWVSDKLDEASRVGYITVAFGLRVRTPLLHQVVRNTRATPYEAQAEGRSAGNALGQSYCLLNSRALTEFMEKVRAHEDHRLRIKPISQIHDATYLLTRDDVELLSWVNTHLVEAVEWQDDPAIMHDIVKLGGELSIFHPSWAYEAVLSNGATEEDILTAAADHLNTLASKGIIPQA